MSRNCAEPASTAALAAMPVFRARLPQLPALIGFAAIDRPAPIRQLHRDRDAALARGTVHRAN